MRLGLGPALALRYSVEERLKLMEPSPPYDNPLAAGITARLHEHDDAPGVLDALTRETFGEGIVFDAFSGGKYTLRLGESSPRATDRFGRVSNEQRKEVGALPAVHEQGDGMRSFVGLVAAILTAKAHVVVVDEPEAFLHPPQAAALGRALVSKKAAHTQLFVTTHDANLLRGILDSASGDVTVVRLDRGGSQVTSATLLDSSFTRRLWESPLLRYSSLTDALFHHGIIVCEGDADCRLYESVIDEQGLRQQGTDIQLAHVGGKRRVPEALETLVGLGIRAAAILDVDVLNDDGLLRRLVKAVGGEWNDGMTKDWNRLKSWADSKRSRPTAAELRTRLEHALKGTAAAKELPDLVLQDVRDAAKVRSGWSELKGTGVNGLRGEERSAAERLIDALAEFGLHVVPNGALESWYPTAPHKSSRHVAEVHDQGLHKDQGKSEQLSKFLLRVIAGLGGGAEDDASEEQEPPPPA